MQNEVSRRALIFAGLPALALAGCAGISPQTVVADIQQLCSTTQVLVSIVSSIPAIAPYSIAIGAGAAIACNEGVALIQAAIDAITGQGGTATVTATAQNNAPAAKALARMLVAKYGVAAHVRRMTSNSIVFVVTPF